MSVEKSYVTFGNRFQFRSTKSEIWGWHVWIGCHAEFISASLEILNQVQDDVSHRLSDGFVFVSDFDIRI
jgi:hypothetical protein